MFVSLGVEMAIKVAGDAAAELVKTTALEEFKKTNDEEDAVLSASKANAIEVSTFKGCWLWGWHMYRVWWRCIQTISICWCEVRVEGLETLDYFDNLSKRERYT
ncbi:hypothetical protein Hanom_Chr04g00313551 [Helianthus anomalus]